VVDALELDPLDEDLELAPLEEAEDDLELLDDDRVLAEEDRVLDGRELRLVDFDDLLALELPLFDDPELEALEFRLLELLLFTVLLFGTDLELVYLLFDADLFLEVV